MVRIGDVYRNLEPYEGEGDLVVIALGTNLGNNIAECEHINNTKYKSLNGSIEIKDFSTLSESFKKIGFVNLQALSLANDILSQSNRHTRASDLKRHLLTDLDIIHRKTKALIELIGVKSVI